MSVGYQVDTFSDIIHTYVDSASFVVSPQDIPRAIRKKCAAREPDFSTALEMTMGVPGCA